MLPVGVFGPTLSIVMSRCHPPPPWFSSAATGTRDTAITVVVVVFGSFLTVLAIVYIRKGLKHNNSSKHTVLPSPENGAATSSPSAHGHASPTPAFANVSAPAPKTAGTDVV